MIWYEDFYAGEKIAGKKEKIKRKILCNAGQLDIFVIALSSNPQNLLEIIPSRELLQKYYPKRELFVVGIDKGYDNAVALAGEIIMDVFLKTGSLNVRDYFQKNLKKETRRRSLWKSCS